MATIVMSDDGIVFDGASLDEGPLGGAETSFVELANAFAQRGHDVLACTRCPTERVYRGVRWRPIEQGIPDQADLYIANRGDKLIRHCQDARQTIFWIHNPAHYLLKARYQWKLALRRPIIVFSGPSHAGTYPGWAFGGGREVVPYGVSDLFRHAHERQAPPFPRAIFTSNPLRSLDWLLNVWATRIHPAMPQAELHIFAGAATYGSAGDAKAEQMRPVLEQAAALSAQGVVLRGPVAKARLVEELAAARVLLYRGDVGETFCSAVAEAQAMGVPVVVEAIACLPERIRTGETGFCVEDEEAFAAAALRLLREDGLWRDQHRAALARQRGWGWDQAAMAFERIGGLTG